MRALALMVFMVLPVPLLAADNIYQQAADKQRYETCLNLANVNPAAALANASQWSGQKGGPPAQHCAAVALVGLKRYAEAAQKLDALGHAPGMGELRPSLFDQAGNAWLLQGETGKAVDSFQAALTLSSRDPDLYADLARAQAVQADWPEVEADLNAALALSPKRADLLVLRASARHAQNRIADARGDVETALALQPRNSEGLVERGALRRDSGDLKGARGDFQAALALNPPPETADAARRNIAALDAAQKPLAAKVTPKAAATVKQPVKKK